MNAIMEFFKDGTKKKQQKNMERNKFWNGEEAMIIHHQKSIGMMIGIQGLMKSIRIFQHQSFLKESP